MKIKDSEDKNIMLKINSDHRAFYDIVLPSLINKIIVDVQDDSDSEISTEGLVLKLNDGSELRIRYSTCEGRIVYEEKKYKPTNIVAVIPPQITIPPGSSGVA